MGHTDHQESLSLSNNSQTFPQHGNGVDSSGDVDSETTQKACDYDQESLPHSELSSVGQASFEQNNKVENGSDDNPQPNKQDVRVTVRKSYTQLAVAGFCLCFGNLAYFTMAAVYTSLNAQLGFIAFGVLWLTLMLTQMFIASPMVNAFGPRITVCLGNISSTFFILLNYYQSWPTLIFGGFFHGLGAGLRWIGTYSIVNTAAKELAKLKNKAPERYIAIFNGILLLSFFSSTLIGSMLSSAFLLPTKITSLFQLSTDGLHMDLFSARNSANQTHETCSETSDEFVVPDWAYYSLITTGTVFSLVSIGVSLCLRDAEVSFRGLCDSSQLCRAATTNSKFHTAFKQFVAKYYKPVLGSFLRFRYITIMIISFLNGVSRVFYFGTFSRHFISECLGVGIVGLCVITWGLGSLLASVFLGKITYYTSRTLVALLTALLHAGMLLVMLFWERQPSYVMVFLMSLGWGITDGVWATLPAIYLGIVAKSQETNSAFAVNLGFLSLGGSICFFVSAYIDVDIVLWVLLSILVVAVVFYVIGEKVFTPSKCCIQKASSDECPTCPSQKSDSAVTMATVVQIADKLKVFGRK